MAYEERGPLEDDPTEDDPTEDLLDPWSDEEPDEEEESDDEPVVSIGEGECRVRFVPSGRMIGVERGTLLIDAARAAGLPVAQSCGGFAVCSWCRMQVLDGLGHLSEIEPNEARLIRRQAFLPHERASCQAEIFGDVTVTTTYW